MNAADPDVVFAWLHTRRCEIEQAAARIAAEAAAPALPKPVSWSDILAYYANAMRVEEPPYITPDLFRPAKVDLDREFRQAKIELSNESLARAIERDQERAAARRFAQAWDSVMFGHRNPFVAIEATA